MRLYIFLSAALVAMATHAQDVLVPFTSSNLPIIVINTHGATILDDPKIAADMGIIDNGTERNNVSDPFNGFAGKIGIEIRGSSSQMFPKKQYGIELSDDVGEGMAASLLGMPEEEDWVLFAPYNDKSLMRDALAYNLGRELAGYTPRARYCEVVLNGNYQGVYVLIEKIKRDKNRLDLNKLDPDEISGNNLTGGYIFKIDKTTGGSGEGWTSYFKPPMGTSQDIYFQYEYPKAKDIAPEQQAYIQSYVRQFENALMSEQFADPEVGYAKYIDVDSFIDYMLMQELTRNVDGYRLSTFMYKQRDTDGGKIHMGPIWDFNLAFGNADYCDGGETTGWALDFNSVCSGDYWLIPFWWRKLLRDETFGAKVGQRWATLRSGAYTSARIHARIDSMTTMINEAQERNFKAWNVLGRYVWPNRYVGASFTQEVNYLKSWIDQRLAWMDANMPGLITAVDENIDGNFVHAVPNPVVDAVSIEYKLAAPAEVHVQIVDALGRVMVGGSFSHMAPGTFQYSWDASRAAAGLYYFKVVANDRMLGSGKLVHR